MQKDKIFTIEGLKKEFGRIRWPKWVKGETKGEETILPTTGKVIFVMSVFSAFFVLCDALLALLLTF